MKVRSYAELKAARRKREAERRKPRAPIARTAKPKRRPVPKAESARQYGPPAFRDHLHASPCLWCGITRPIEQAHFGKHGTGKKNDWTATGPLCGAVEIPGAAYGYPGCHARLDRREMPGGWEWFTRGERAELARRQKEFVAAWRRHQGAVNG